MAFACRGSDFNFSTNPPSRRCLSPLGVDARGRAAPHRECVRRVSAAFWVCAACGRWVKAYTTPCIVCKHPHAPHSVVHWGAAIPPGRPPSQYCVSFVLSIGCVSSPNPQVGACVRPSGENRVACHTSGGIRVTFRARSSAGGVTAASA